MLAKLGKQSKLVISDTFFTSVGVENFSGVSGTPLEYNARGKPLLCVSSLNGHKMAKNHWLLPHFSSIFCPLLPSRTWSLINPEHINYRLELIEGTSRKTLVVKNFCHRGFSGKFLVLKIFLPTFCPFCPHYTRFLRFWFAHVGKSGQKWAK